MSYTYDKPLVLQSGPQELKIAKVTTGTATVELADGRLILITIIGVDGAWVNASNAEAVDVRPAFTVEMMTKPEFPVADGPGTIQ